MKTTLIIVGSLVIVGIVGFVVYKQMHKGGATNSNGQINSGDGTPEHPYITAASAGINMGRKQGKI